MYLFLTTDTYDGYNLAAPSRDYLSANVKTHTITQFPTSVVNSPAKHLKHGSFTVENAVTQ